MAKGLGGSGFFGFIDILHGLPVVPKIIMFVGLMALIAGFFSGAFSLFSNAKIATGVALMSASLGWRDWSHTVWHSSGPPYRAHLDFGRAFKGLLFFSAAAWLFRIAYLASLKLI